MKVTVEKLRGVGVAAPVAARCPHCGYLGTLEKVCGDDAAINDSYFSGQRRCPNPDCHGLVFVVLNRGRLERSYPPSRIDFDATDVPIEIRTALVEAIGCHAAECFTAAAIMVRKTLEEVCSKEGATGATLEHRIKALGSKITISKALLDAMDDLRLLGNDAAHVEMKHFLNVSKEDVEIAIAIAKEIVKALYQHDGLLRQLQARKK